MTDDDRAARIARHLLEANDKRLKFDLLTGELEPRSLGEAYAAQTELIDLWRETGHGRVAGWKIALTSKPMQELCGVDQPLVGCILDRRVYESGAQISLADFVHLGLEFELAVRIGAHMDASDHPYDAARAMTHVEAVMPAFELIEDRGADYAELNALSLTADNTWNGGVVLGPEIERWQDVDWTAQPVTLTYNDEVETAVTGAAMGNPFNALAEVAENLLHRGMHLRAGDVVITGSTVKTRFPVAGDRVRYAIDGLGEVAATVVA